MDIARSVLLFVIAALAEIGGAWLVWQGVREQRGLLWIGAGLIALGLCGNGTRGFRGFLVRRGKPRHR